ncbi:MAG: response regulator [Desulfobulbaceae bacterium]|nr:response regulator [Desulfobulbaceae bacterium]
MSSIALFTSTFTKEKEIREKLAMASGYAIVQDNDIIEEVCRRYKQDKDKVAEILYNRTSVFNKFTLERERTTIYLKLVMAEQIKRSRIIFSGFITHLIPSSVSHILKVAVFDEKKGRIQRAIVEGLTEKNATKLIRNSDIKAMDWTDFLFAKQASDPSLYDIVIPVGATNAEAVVQLIMENYHKPAVLETETSRHAVIDMTLGAQVELALVEKGYTPTVLSSKGNITLLVNKSVLSFSKLADTLKAIAQGVSGVQRVEVATGKNYYVSVYRAQEFSLPPKVLLVDDEQEFVQTLSDRLNTRNYGSYPVFDGEQALDLLDHETPDVIVLDLKMPGMGGIEVLFQAKVVKPEIEIIILTGHGSEEDEKTCMKLGAYAYLQKPVDIAQLTTMIDEAYKKVAAAKLAQAELHT